MNVSTGVCSLTTARRLWIQLAVKEQYQTINADENQAQLDEVDEQALREIVAGRIAARRAAFAYAA